MTILLRVGWWLFSEMGARVLVGLGIAFVTHQFGAALITGPLDLLASKLGQLPSDVFAILTIGGVTEWLSIVGAAIMTRASWQIGERIVAWKRKNYLFKA